MAGLTLEALAARAARAAEAHREALLRSTEYRVDCLSSAVLTRSPALFLDSVAWSKVLLARRGLAEPELTRSLDALREVLTRSPAGALRRVVTPLLDEAARACPQTANLPILVGGHPFQLVPDLWRIVGANGTTSSAREAVERGRAPVERGTGP